MTAVMSAGEDQGADTFRLDEGDMEETLFTARDAVMSITHKGFIFLDNDSTASDWSFARICEEAGRIGSCLRAEGMSQGDRIALVLKTPEKFVLSFLGAVSAGIMPVPLYPPLALGRLDNYIDKAVGILRVSGAKALLANSEFFPLFKPVLPKTPDLARLLDIETLREPAGSPAAGGVFARPDDPCFLQFTSGSTSDPRGVIVTHRNLIANARAIIASLQIDSEKDRAVSWLPLYHDMGLIGFVIATLVAKISVVFIPTVTFAKHPGIWMETVHRHRATITFGPNFAFDLAAKRAPKNPRSDFDLSCLRVLGCGAEPINPRTMDHFIETFSPWGLKPNALMPSYGMAEATLAIAFDHLNRPLQKLIIDRHAYESENRALPVENNGRPHDPQKRMELISCGRPIPGHEVRIVDDNGNPLPEGCVGEIVFKGPSVTPGYFRNPKATGQLLKNGWLHTGDLGFIHRDDLYISGRQKDLVIINGRNYPPQAIEWIVEEIAGIRKGSVVAFSIAGECTEKLVIIAETAAAGSPDLIRTIHEQVRSALGLVVDKVVLVKRGSIPKTSSGKLQRRRTRALFESGILDRQTAAANSASPERMAAG
ncbi:MAG TPA: fatty acyl-AMP ligase [Acidobacteriota bacterium]|nr:fatty acyl-AMP ligase [Acidobacteriota bacterium]